MGLILLEALLALCIFIAIVWWTMFSGRSKGELRQAQPPSKQPSDEASEPAPNPTLSEAASTAAPTPDETRR